MGKGLVARDDGAAKPGVVAAKVVIGPPRPPCHFGDIFFCRRVSGGAGDGLPGQLSQRGQPGCGRPGRGRPGRGQPGPVHPVRQSPVPIGSVVDVEPPPDLPDPVHELAERGARVGERDLVELPPVVAHRPHPPPLGAIRVAARHLPLQYTVRLVKRSVPEHGHGVDNGPDAGHHQPDSADRAPQNIPVGPKRSAALVGHPGVGAAAQVDLKQRHWSKKILTRRVF